MEEVILFRSILERIDTNIGLIMYEIDYSFVSYPHSQHIRAIGAHIYK